MPNQSKAIAFDVDQSSLSSLRKALPDCVIEVVNGATPASLTRDWNPGTVDLFVVKARQEVAQTLELCRFLVSCGVLGKEAPVVTDSQETLPKTLGLHRRRRHVARRPHSPVLVLVSPRRRSIVKDVLKAGAHSCLVLPINAKDVASMLGHAQRGTSLAGTRATSNGLKRRTSGGMTVDRVNQSVQGRIPSGSDPGPAFSEKDKRA